MNSNYILISIIILILFYVLVGKSKLEALTTYHSRCRYYKGGARSTDPLVCLNVRNGYCTPARGCNINKGYALINGSQANNLYRHQKNCNRRFGSRFWNIAINRRCKQGICNKALGGGGWDEDCYPWSSEKNIQYTCCRKLKSPIKFRSGKWKNQANGQCLDIYGGRKTSNTHLIQWPCHRGLNQKFQYDQNRGIIRPRHTSNRYLEGRRGYVVQMPYKRWWGHNQKFIYNPYSKEIKHLATRKCFQGGKKAGSVINLKRCNGSSSQKWGYMSS